MSDPQLLEDIERGERWLAQRLAMSVDDAVIARLQRRVRTEIASTAHGETPDEALGLAPAPATIARVKQAIRTELFAPVRPVRRALRPRIIAWGLSVSAAAAVLLVVLTPQRPNLPSGSDGARRPLSLDSFVEALDRPADDDEQALNTLAEDLAKAEDLSVTLITNAWDDVPVDDFSDELDDMYINVDSAWDIS
jgi:hypothetical protein